MKTVSRSIFKSSPLFAVLLASLSVTVSGQFWAKKDSRHWSKGECGKLLQHSPWSKRYILDQVFIEPLSTDSSPRAREQHPQVIYQVQFRSALPIRQAIVRLQQLNMKYDKLSVEEQRAFDLQAERFLMRDFSKVVMLHVTYGSTVPFDDQDLARYWQSQTTATLKNSTYLIGAKGAKVSLLQYGVTEGGGRTFQLVFPRQYQGRPLVTAGDKSLKLEFQHPRIRDQSGSRVLIEFKVKKMLKDGAVAY